MPKFHPIRAGGKYRKYEDKKITSYFGVINKKILEEAGFLKKNEEQVEEVSNFTSYAVGESIILKKESDENDCEKCKHNDQFCLTPSKECWKCLNNK